MVWCAARGLSRLPAATSYRFFCRDLPSRQFSSSASVPGSLRWRLSNLFEVVGARIAGLPQSEIHQLELAQAARRFRSLAEADPFGMVIGGLEGDLRYVNPAFLKTLGYYDAEVSSGQVRWDSLTPPEYAQADVKAVEQLRTSGRCQVYEKAYLSKDGRRIPILIGASVIDSS